MELNLLGERLVLQGSCAFLALLMVNICLCFIEHTTYACLLAASVTASAHETQANAGQSTAPWAPRAAPCTLKVRVGPHEGGLQILSTKAKLILFILRVLSVNLLILFHQRLLTRNGQRRTLLSINLLLSFHSLGQQMDRKIGRQPPARDCKLIHGVD